MKPGQFQQRLSDMKTWSRRHERAPHKPLLLLLAFGYFLQGHSRLRPYKEIERELRELLVRFGPPRVIQHPEQPLFRLQRDGLWELQGLQSSHFDDSGQLRPHLVQKSAVQGGLPVEVHNFLIEHPPELRLATQYLLFGHFPESMHADLLAAVNLGELLIPTGQWEESTLLKTRTRDPRFRPDVISAYGHQCAICSYDIRLQDQLMGLEAAHILCHANGGPDEIANGLALCVIHHRAFDRGGIGLGCNLELLVSSDLRGKSEAWSYWFQRFAGRPIQTPFESWHQPGTDFLQWHRTQVFRDVE